MNRDFFFFGFHPRKGAKSDEHGETEDSVIMISLHRKFSLGYLQCMVDFSKGRVGIAS